VFVSFDDGEHWQSLRVNMPASSIRDLVIHEDDVVVATHGRGFWILDDIEPLRQQPQLLLEPQRAWRFRWNKNTDTPLPADEPAGQNPPDGAILDYYLTAPASEVTLEIVHANGTVVRRFTSRDEAAPPKDTGNVPWYWIRPQRTLATSPGMHRSVWDLHYTPVPPKTPSFPIAAIPHDTAPDYSSPWVLPGTYIVRLTADGKAATQPLLVQIDPRVKTPPEGLEQQFALSMKVYEALKQSPSEELETKLRTLLDALQSADTAPSAQLVKAVEEVTGK
jgi:hypothetical protein